MTAPGGPEVLKLEERPVPRLERDTDVLVRLKAAGVNPLDTKLRTKPAYGIQPPAVLGCDGAGVVEAVGAQVTEFRPGDEVYFCQAPFGGRIGTYAHYTLVDHRLLALKPAALSFEQAAAVPLALITAWESLRERASVQSGQRVLIHAGAGGVGHLAIQLARSSGASVCTTVSNEAKAAFVTELGADLAILYKQKDFVKETLAWTQGQGVDIALDTVGGKTFAQTFNAVRCYGDLVTLLLPAVDTDWGVARLRNLRICFEIMLTPLLLGLDEAIRHQGHILRQAAVLLDEGRLLIQVADVLPLAEAAEAHRRLESGAVMGKLVLRIE